MVTLNEQFPSKWLKAADLDGPVVTTVHETDVEPVKDMNGVTNKKCVVYFEGDKLKPLILNRTNFEALVDISGSDDSEGFVGAKIELYTIETQMGEGIRIREPGGKSKKNQRQRPVKKAEPLPPIEKDMDDEIPF
jgi:hypothetical protein